MLKNTANSSVQAWRITNNPHPSRKHASNMRCVVVIVPLFRVYRSRKYWKSSSSSLRGPNFWFPQKERLWVFNTCSWKYFRSVRPFCKIPEIVTSSLMGSRTVNLLRKITHAIRRTFTQKVLQLYVDHVGKQWKQYDSNLPRPSHFFHTISLWHECCPSKSTIGLCRPRCKVPEAVRENFAVHMKVEKQQKAYGWLDIISTAYLSLDF